MMNFLASMLRDEGGFEYKKAIVDTIITIVDENPAAKDLGMFIFSMIHIEVNTFRSFSFVRVHRGLRTSCFGYSCIAPSWPRRSNDSKSGAVHSLHL